MATMEEIETMVALQLGRRRVDAGDRIIADLGAESVDVVNIIANVEDRYDIAIEEGELPRIETVGDLYECVRQKLARGSR